MVRIVGFASLMVVDACKPPGCPQNTCSFYGCTSESGTSRCTSGGAATYCDQSSLQCIGPFTQGPDGLHYGYCMDKFGASNSSLAKIDASKSDGIENLKATTSVEVGTSCTPPGCPQNTCSFYGCTSESGTSRCTSGGAATYCDQSSLQCIGPFTQGPDGLHYGYCMDKFGASNSSLAKIDASKSENLKATTSAEVGTSCTPPGCPQNTCSFYGCTSESGTSRCTSGGAATYCDQSSLQCVGPFTQGPDGLHYGYCMDKFGASNSSLSNVDDATNSVEVGTSCTPPGCPQNTCSFYGCTSESGTSRCTSGGAATYCDQPSLQCIGPFTQGPDGLHYGYCTDKYGATKNETLIGEVMV